MPFVAAGATNDEGHPVATRLSRVKDFRKDEIAAWAQVHIDANSIVRSDGLACFGAIADQGFEHQPVVTGGGPSSVEWPEFRWVNTILDNVRTAMQGTHHHASARHLPRYLAEFSYRFNQRFDISAMLTRLGWAAVRTPLMPYR